MELKIKDIVDLLKVSERTVYRWIKEKKIPAYKINSQYRFSKSEIYEWILKNKIEVSDKILELQLSNEPINLVNLISKGGIYYNIEGNSIKEVITNSVKTINLSPEINKNQLISALLEREELMSTSIGNGIAFPHPRQPIITDYKSLCIAICFLKNNVDFKSIDNTLVNTLIIILSPNPKRHLEVLAKLSFLCQDINFRNLLYNRASKEDILEYISNKEKEWNIKKE